MAATLHQDPTVAAAGARLAELLGGAGGLLVDPSRSDLVFDRHLEPVPLERSQPPVEVWAVDGGQALVADARCLQLYAVRAARVCWRAGQCFEEEGALQAFLFGLGEEARAAREVGLDLPAGTPVDVNLVRDWKEWHAVGSCVTEAAPGAMVLVDGDLQPDWRVPSSWLSALFSSAAGKGVRLVGVTKHSSLAWGGTPLLAHLEQLAEEVLGPRSCWWARVARTRADVVAGIQVVVARLDPDARFAFRVDLPAELDPVTTLAELSALCDDAAFPGYPYPLSVADRLAACSPHVRDEVWAAIEEQLDRAGTSLEVRDRAFTDRHRLMERA